MFGCWQRAIRCLITCCAMLMGVMPQMVCSTTCFMLAIRTRQYPRRLEWQTQQEENKQQAAHGLQYQRGCVWFLLKVRTVNSDSSHLVGYLKVIATERLSRIIKYCLSHRLDKARHDLLCHRHQSLHRIACRHRDQSGKPKCWRHSTMLVLRPAFPRFFPHRSLSSLT